MACVFALPNFLMEVVGTGVDAGFNHRHHSTDQPTARQQVSHAERYGKVNRREAGRFDSWSPAKRCKAADFTHAFSWK